LQSHRVETGICQRLVVFFRATWPQYLYGIHQVVSGQTIDTNNFRGHRHAWGHLTSSRTCGVLKHYSGYDWKQDKETRINGNNCAFCS